MPSRNEREARTTMIRPVVHNKWLLAAAVVWAAVGYVNFAPHPLSTTPHYMWIVNIVTSALMALAAFRKPRTEE